MEQDFTRIWFLHLNLKTAVLMWEMALAILQIIATLNKLAESTLAVSLFNLLSRNVVMKEEKYFFLT